MDHFILVILTVSTVSVLGGKQKHETPKGVNPTDFWEVEDLPECTPSTCPEPQGKTWRHLQRICCPHDDTDDDEGYFHCQEDDKGSITVMCAVPKLCPPGKFASLEGKKLAVLKAIGQRSFCQTCPMHAYQPTANYSYTFLRPACSKTRTNCEDLGAVAAKTGNSSSDDLCMCDWLSNYRPVSKSSYHCRTFNSSHASTCSCVYQNCPADHALHPKNFKCIKIDDITEDYYRMQREYLHTLKHRLDGQLDILLAQIEEQSRRHSYLHELQDLQKVLEWWQQLLRVPVEHLVGQHTEEPQTLMWYQMSWRALVILCAVTVCATYILYHVYSMRKGGQNVKDMLVRVTFMSHKAADTFHKEVKNILPMLAHHYGELSLAHDSHSTFVSIVIRPKDERPLYLTHFIRDIMSPEAVKRKIVQLSSHKGDDIQICVWRGFFEDAGKAHVGHTPPPDSSGVVYDAGKIILRFSEEEDQNVFLKKLRDTSAKDSLTTIFSKHHLEFQNVHSGSIIFRFHLPNGSRTFNAMAADQRIKDFTKDLLSHEAFKNLAKDVQVKVEFFCKARLDNVCVVRADNLTVQIGMHNKVIMCDQHPSSRCDHASADSADADDSAQDDDTADDDVFLTKADGFQTAVGEMLKVNTLNVNVRSTAAATRRGVEDSWVTENRDQNDVFIEVRSHTQEMNQRLRTQWLNILPLLKNYYPGCQMHCRGKRVFWRLRASGGGKMPDTTGFLMDIFAIENVKFLAMESNPRVNVLLSECAMVPLSFRQRCRDYLKRSVATLHGRLKLLFSFFIRNIIVVGGLLCCFLISWFCCNIGMP